MMVLLAEDAGVATGPNQHQAAAQRPNLKVRRSRVVARSLRVTTGGTNEHCSYSSV